MCGINYPFVGNGIQVYTNMYLVLRTAGCCSCHCGTSVMADAEEGGGGGGDPRLEVLCQYCLKTLKVRLLLCCQPVICCSV